MFLGDSFARWISIGSPQNKDTRAKNESKGILTADNIDIVSGHTMFIQIFLRFLSDLSNNRNDHLFQTQKEIFLSEKARKDMRLFTSLFVRMMCSFSKITVPALCRHVKKVTSLFLFKLLRNINK